MSCLFLSCDFIFYFMQKLVLTVDLRCCHALEITYQLDHIRIETGIAPGSEITPCFHRTNR